MFNRDHTPLVSSGHILTIRQGIDGSARKPALVQDTGYVVEKTDHIAKYLGAFGTYLKPQ